MSSFVERLLELWRLGDDVVGINARNLELLFEDNPPAEARKVDDKLVTKERLEEIGVAVPRTLATFESLTEVARLGREIASLDGFVVKPVVGSGGVGVLVVAGAPDGGGWTTPSGGRWKPISEASIATHVREVLCGLQGGSDRVSGRAFLEELLTLHPFFDGLTSGGLPDLRVLVRDGEALMAMLRLPTRRSAGKANLHQGAVGVGVDLATGKTHDAVLRGRRLERHPDTGRELIGLSLPDWPGTLELAVQSASAFELGFVGVDLILDRARGPLVIELNARPGVAIQLANGRGLRTAIGRRER